MRFVRGFLVVMTLWGAGSGAAQAADAPGPPPELRDVKVEQRGAAVAVTVATSGQPKYEATLLDSPVRLVVDISGTFASPRSRWTGVPEPLKEVRGSQLKPGTARLVVELNRKVGLPHRGRTAGPHRAHRRTRGRRRRPRPSPCRSGPPRPPRICRECRRRRSRPMRRRPRAHPATDRRSERKPPSRCGASTPPRHRRPPTATAATPRPSPCRAARRPRRICRNAGAAKPPDAPSPRRASTEPTGTAEACRRVPGVDHASRIVAAPSPCAGPLAPSSWLRRRPAAPAPRLPRPRTGPS